MSKLEIVANTITHRRESRHDYDLETTYVSVLHKDSGRWVGIHAHNQSPKVCWRIEYYEADKTPELTEDVRNNIPNSYRAFKEWVEEETA